MPKKSTPETEAERAAAERVDKAAFINDEVMDRLHQYDGEDAGVRPAPDAREDHAYPKAKAVTPEPDET